MGKTGRSNRRKDDTDGDEEVDDDVVLLDDGEEASQASLAADRVDEAHESDEQEITMLGSSPVGVRSDEVAEESRQKAGSQKKNTAVSQPKKKRKAVVDEESLSSSPGNPPAVPRSAVSRAPVLSSGRLSVEQHSMLLAAFREDYPGTGPAVTPTTTAAAAMAGTGLGLPSATEVLVSEANPSGGGAGVSGKRKEKASAIEVHTIESEDEGVARQTEKNGSSDRQDEISDDELLTVKLTSKIAQEQIGKRTQSEPSINSSTSSGSTVGAKVPQWLPDEPPTNASALYSSAFTGSNKTHTVENATTYTRSLFNISLPRPGSLASASSSRNGIFRPGSAAFPDGTASEADIGYAGPVVDDVSLAIVSMSSIESTTSPASSLLLVNCPFTPFGSRDFREKQWMCGYRNLQSMWSAVFQGQPVPSHLEVQRRLEEAWKNGFDPEGAADFGCKIRGTECWIGTTEIYTVFTAHKVNCQIIDFVNVRNNYARMIEFLRTRVLYHGDKHSVYPLYFQYEGHSLVIFGTWQKGPETKVLVIDPSRSSYKSHDSCSQYEFLSQFFLDDRRLVRHDQFSVLVVVDTGLSDVEVRNRKRLRSLRIDCSDEYVLHRSYNIYQLDRSR